MFAPKHGPNRSPRAVCRLGLFLRFIFNNFHLSNTSETTQLCQNPREFQNKEVKTVKNLLYETSCQLVLTSCLVKQILDSFDFFVLSFAEFCQSWVVSEVLDRWKLVNMNLRNNPRPRTARGDPFGLCLGATAQFPVEFLQKQTSNE